MALERPTKEGNSPVGENGFILLIIMCLNGTFADEANS